MQQQQQQCDRADSPARSGVLGYSHLCGSQGEHGHDPHQSCVALLGFNLLTTEGSISPRCVGSSLLWDLKWLIMVKAISVRTTHTLLTPLDMQHIVLYHRLWSRASLQRLVDCTATARSPICTTFSLLLSLLHVQVVLVAPPLLLLHCYRDTWLAGCLQ